MLFRPDAQITQLIVYSLGVSARRYGIQVHAFCAMSTHIHIVVTDVRGVLPRFLQFFHRLVALGTKILRTWEGPVWDHEQTSVVHLMTRDAVVQKIAYTLANPVAAGLVQRAHEWPGAKVLLNELGRGVLRARRPTIYFDPTNPWWPEETALPIVLPPCIHKDDADAFRREVAAEVAAEEVRAHAEMKRRGVSLRGIKHAVKVSPHKRATSFEPLRKRNPTFAVGRGNEGAWRRAAAAVRAFRTAYRDALERWCHGMRTALFPEGTWWMRVLHAVKIAASPGVRSFPGSI
jgi:putative transposase